MGCRMHLLYGRLWRGGGWLGGRLLTMLLLLLLGVTLGPSARPSLARAHAAAGWSASDTPTGTSSGGSSFQRAKTSKVSGIAGPWWTYPIRQVLCPDSLKINYKMRAKFTPLNTPRSSAELQRCNCTVDLETTLDDSMHAVVSFDAASNNQWKENAIAPIKVKRGLCTFFKNLIPDFSRKLFSKFVGVKPCAVTPGHYEIVDTPINWTYPTLPYFFYGHYRFRMVAGSAEENNMCFGIEFKVFPK